MNQDKKYMDEKILEMKELQEKEDAANMDIGEKLMIYDIEYNIKENIIIDDYLYIMLPDYFWDMPEELKILLLVF